MAESKPPLPVIDPNRCIQCGDWLPTGDRFQGALSFAGRSVKFGMCAGCYEVARRSGQMSFNVYEQPPPPPSR